MNDPALTLWVSYKRDTILLTATALGVAGWAWSQPPLEMAVAGLICSLLYVALVTMVRHGQAIEQEAGFPVGRGAFLIWAITTLLSGGTSLVLLTIATWDAFAQTILTLAVAVLIAAWQGWFYFWMER